MNLILQLVVLAVGLATPGPKAAFCEEKYLLPPLKVACGSTCTIVDCGSGRCPTCPFAGNVFFSAWGSYRCANGKGMFLLISALGGKRLEPRCLD